MYTYYAGFEDGTTISEILQMETEEQILNVLVYEDGDANNAAKTEIEVKVIAPKGYTLTDRDHANIDELLADER